MGEVRVDDEEATDGVERTGRVIVGGQIDDWGGGRWV